MLALYDNRQFQRVAWRKLKWGTFADSGVGCRIGIGCKGMSDNAIISITMVIVIKVVLIIGNNGVSGYQWCYQMLSITFDT